MKILSIDFDIIMAPSIELYNERVPGMNWEELTTAFPLLAFCQADLTHYRRLIEYLIKIAPFVNKDDIHIAFGHQKILDSIPEDEDNVVINIDHHHDLGYGDNPLDKEGTCANWALTLFKHNKLKQYTWLHNTNFENFSDEVKDNYKDKILDYNLSDVEDLHESYGTPDIIFICLSPEWVPPEYRELFYSMLDILNVLKDTFFQLED